jgi:hypothetical protein
MGLMMLSLAKALYRDGIRSKQGDGASAAAK